VKGRDFRAVAITREYPARGFGVRLLDLIFAIFVGCVLFTIALPKKTMTLATEWEQPWLGDAARQLTALTNRLPAFSLLLEWIGFALAGYVGALLMLALWHRRPGLFGWGFATLALAATSLYLFAWFGFIAYHVTRFVLMIFEVVRTSFAGFHPLWWISSSSWRVANLAGLHWSPLSPCSSG
jgi:hypothetical protein